MKTVSIQLNRALRGKPAGAVVRVPANRDGLPKDRYWRDRLKDAVTDGCCEIKDPSGSNFGEDLESAMTTKSDTPKAKASKSSSNSKKGE